jgi:hypothetical protein
MPDYANGKIYKIEPICDHKVEEVYFGSTTRRLCDRWGNHKSKFKTNNNKCCSVILFSKYGIENCHILLVELVTASSKEELTAREAFYIRNNNCINKNIPDRKPAEYHTDNKEKIDEYRAENKDKIAENRAEYYIKNKDKIDEERAKYNIKNKDRIAEYYAEYYIKNKDKIKKQQAEYINKKLI